MSSELLNFTTTNEKYSRRTKFAKNKTAKRIQKIKDSKRAIELNMRAAQLNKIKPLDPHSYEQDILSVLKSVQDATTHVAPEQRESVSEWIGHLESLAILAYHVNGAKCWTDIVVAIVGFAKMYVKDQSLICALYAMIEHTEEELETHAFDVVSVRETWASMRSHPMWRKMHSLVVGVMSMTACQIKDITWNVAGFEIIKIEAAEKAINGFDFLDSAIQVFSWMWETGSACIAQKSLAPMLYADQEISKFNENCDYVLAYADTACTGDVDDINEFQRKVTDCITKVIALKKARTTGPTAAWLQNKYADLVALEERLIAKRKNTGLRFQPMGWLLTGPSGVGKSTLSQLTMKTSLSAMGFSFAREGIITYSMEDAYDSSYSNDVEGIYIDDVGNVKSTFATKAITDLVIRMFNNMSAQAVKAELNEKGRVFINFKCGVLTSNHEHGDFGSYTNCLSSTLRRFYSVRTHIKPQYRVSNGVSLNTNHPDLNSSDLTQDVWELDILETIPLPSMKATEHPFKQVVVEYVDDTGKKVVCSKMSLAEYLKAVVFLSRGHKRKQTNLLARAKRFEEMAMCTECGLPTDMCVCTKPHSWEELSDAVGATVMKSMTTYLASVFSPVVMLNNMVGYAPVRKLTTKVLEKELNVILNNGVTPMLFNCVPNFLLESTWGQRYVNVWAANQAYGQLKRYVRLFQFGFVCSGSWTLANACRGKSLTLPGLTLVAPIVPACFLMRTYCKRIEQVKGEYFRRRDALPQSCSVKTNGAKCALAVATAVVGMAMIRMWNDKRVQDLQMNSDRDSEPGWFGWVMGSKKTTYESDERVNHSSTSHMRNIVSRNLCWMDVEREDGSKTRCNAFFPRTSVMWIPRHVFYPGADVTRKPSRLLTIDIQRNKSPGSKFRARVSLNQCVSVGGLDMVAAYVPNSPLFSDVSHILPKTSPDGTCAAKMVVRGLDLSLNTTSVLAKSGKLSHCGFSYDGVSYNTDLARVGACMGVVIADKTSPVVLGFHIAGRERDNYGVSQTVTCDMYEQSCLELENLYGVTLSAKAGEIPSTQYGKPLIESTEIHPLCKLATADENTCVNILGATSLRSTQKSRVVESELSPHVAEITGVENKWGPPKMSPNWAAYNKTLEHVVNPADPFDPDLVVMAMKDWVGPVKEALQEWAKTEEVRPLTLEESVLGIDGKRFIDAIPMNTSMGFPIFQAKHKWFEEKRENGVLVSRTPHVSVLKEMERQKQCWLQGTRAYPVTAATLKDEPTPLDSEKVRVFQGGSVAFGIWLRIYFLPILRFMHHNPTLTESAVGVNAMGPEWQILMEHAEKYATDEKMIAWDYSKYDVRMSSQITRSVMYLFIELAKSVPGYTEEDINFMEMMVVDLTHPLIDWNGVMFMAFNMNTSGNNLTVDINGTAGSLYVRIAFFNLFRSVPVGDFRKCVSALTYGDDFIGSVVEKYRDFNFEYFKAFLAKHKMKVTLPSKDNSSSEFLDKEDVDFLKRKSNYIPEIDQVIGKLDENSIFKSLHSNVKSKNCSTAELQRSVLQGAMHEWFAHGKDVYNMRLKQMEEVCRRVDLPAGDILLPFESRVEHWVQKYRR
nr:hypothetical protein 1 [Mute swan feces associated picorna-like virus 26]